MPVTVAVDANGTSVHQTGPARVAAAHRQDSGDGRMANVRHACDLAQAHEAVPPAILTPLATDSASSLNLPPVRMGLLTKLNLLTIGLIFLTAIATTGFYVWQQWRDESDRAAPARRGGARDARRARRVRARTRTTARTSRRSSTASPPTATSPTRSSSTRSARRSPRAASPKRSARAEPPPLPPDAPAAGAGTTTTADLDDPRPALRRADRAGRRHEDRRSRWGSTQGRRPTAAARSSGTAAADRRADRLRAARDDVRPAAAAVPQAPGRRAVRRRAADRAHDRRDVPADARPRRADAPADARGARGGRRASSTSSCRRAPSDELGLLTHTFNHMTQRLSESQAEVGTTSARSRTRSRSGRRSWRSRRRTRTSSRSTTS